MIFVFDGIDGCGKTTVASVIAERLQPYADVHLFRDPGGTPLGETLRAIVKDARQPCSPNVQVLLFSAARAALAEHLAAVEARGAQAGRRVAIVLDRWWFSTYAYQCAQGVSSEFVLSLVKHTAGAPLPARQCFWLDVDPVEAAARIQAAHRSDTVPDRFDGRGRAFAEKLRSWYSALVPLGYLTRVDAWRPLPEVLDRVWASVHAALVEG